MIQFGPPLFDVKNPSSRQTGPLIFINDSTGTDLRHSFGLQKYYVKAGHRTTIEWYPANLLSWKQKPATFLDTVV